MLHITALFVAMNVNIRLIANIDFASVYVIVDMDVIVMQMLLSNRWFPHDSVSKLVLLLLSIV